MLPTTALPPLPQAFQLHRHQQLVVQDVMWASWFILITAGGLIKWARNSRELHKLPSILTHGATTPLLLLLISSR